MFEINAVLLETHAISEWLRTREPAIYSQ